MFSHDFHVSVFHDTRIYVYIRLLVESRVSMVGNYRVSYIGTSSIPPPFTIANQTRLNFPPFHVSIMINGITRFEKHEEFQCATGIIAIKDLQTPPPFSFLSPLIYLPFVIYTFLYFWIAWSRCLWFEGEYTGNQANPHSSTRKKSHPWDSRKLEISPGCIPLQKTYAKVRFEELPHNSLFEWL